MCYVDHILYMISASELKQERTGLLKLIMCIIAVSSHIMSCYVLELQNSKV